MMDCYMQIVMNKDSPPYPPDNPSRNQDQVPLPPHRHEPQLHPHRPRHHPPNQKKEVERFPSDPTGLEVWVVEVGLDPVIAPATATATATAIVTVTES